MDMEIETVPMDIRVMIGGDFQEHDAELVAKDSSLGLAFVQIQDPSALSGIEPITFTTPQRLRVGEELFGINRLGEAYDNEAYVGWTRLAGKVEQPRTMWAIGSGYGARGLPLFNLYGQAVGVLSAQREDTEEGRGGGGGRGGRGGMGMGMMGGGGGAERVFLIPATDVNAVIEQARKKATEMMGGGEASQQVTATEEE